MRTACAYWMTTSSMLVRPDGRAASALQEAPSTARSRDGASGRPAPSHFSTRTTSVSCQPALQLAVSRFRASAVNAAVIAVDEDRRRERTPALRREHTVSTTPPLRWLDGVLSGADRVVCLGAVAAGVRAIGLIKVGSFPVRFRGAPPRSIWASRTQRRLAN